MILYSKIPKLFYLIQTFSEQIFQQKFESQITSENHRRNFDVNIFLETSMLRKFCNRNVSYKKIGKISILGYFKRLIVK